MALTTLDPETALILVDLQKGIAAMETTPPVSEVIGRAATLAEAFRRHGLPVILVHVAGAVSGRTDQPAPVVGALPPSFYEFVPELTPQPGDHVVTKHCWGAFTRTGLEDLLKGLGVTQVVIGGVATSIGVESTARAAFELGFNVTLATDVLADRNPDAHHNSLTRIFPRLGESGDSAVIIALLDQTRTAS